MRKLHGLLVRQHAAAESKAFFVFVDMAKSISHWAETEPTLKVRHGAQRIYSQTHANSISRYLRASNENIIPTAITLALPSSGWKIETWDPGDHPQAKGVSFATLTLSNDHVSTKGKGPKKATKKIGTVIDGQHRLGVLAKFGLPTVACVILGADALEKAVHFVVINNKAKKVPRDLIRAITAELSEDTRDKFIQRVTSLGMALGEYVNATRVLFESASSPFKGLIDWDMNRTGTRCIKPAAVEQSLRILQADLVGEPDLDDALEIFMAMWRGVRSVWKGTPKWGSSLLRIHQKAVVVAVTEFLVDRFNHLAEDGTLDLDDLESIEEHSADIFGSIPRGFWTLQWKESGLDTSAGRELIKEAMAKARLHKSLSKLSYFLVQERSATDDASDDEKE